MFSPVDNYDPSQDVYTPPAVDPAFCNAVINQRQSATTAQTFACAQAGYVGNRPSIVSTLPAPAVQASAPVQMPDIQPTLPTFTPEPPAVVVTPECDPIASWIEQNPILAVGLLAALAVL